MTSMIRQIYLSRHGTTGWLPMWGLFCLILLLPSLDAYATTLQQGKQLYFKGRNAPAEAALKKALKRPGPSSQKAQIYKFLGMAQFMQSKRQSAAQSFRRALSLNPRINVSNDEAIDESMVPFFRQQRASAPASSGAGSRRKSTTLTVYANVPSRILIDGILAGTSGRPLEARPGTLQITIKADGYRSKTVRSRIRPRQNNVLRITLNRVVKSRPKPRISRRARPARQPRQSTPSMFRDQEPQYPSARAAPRSGRSGTNLLNQFNRDGQSAVRPPNPYAVPVQPPASPYSAPAPVSPYGAPSYAVPPTYAAPPSTTIITPVPMYPYGSPSYGSPYSPAPPPYATPPTPYATPPAATPPALDYPRSSLRKKRSNRSRRRPPPSASSYTLALMPFGVGQYQNGDYIFGAFFAGAQLFSLYTYNDASQEIEATKKAAAAASQETQNSEDPNLKIFLQESQTYIDQQAQRRDLALYSFLGLWAFGAVDAVLGLDSAPKKKRRRADHEYNPDHLVDSWAIAPFPMPNGLGLRIDLDF